MFAESGVSTGGCKGSKKWSIREGHKIPKQPHLPSAKPLKRWFSKIGRNDQCWCGSGKKYKKCHLPVDAKRGLT